MPTFWTALAVVQSGDGTFGVTETMESRPLEKICWPVQANPFVFAARLECGVPVPFVI